jgi:hypothetical protein
LKKKKLFSQVQWLMPVIPATQETGVRKIMVQNQSMQKEINKTPSQPISQAWWNTLVVPTA